MPLLVQTTPAAAARRQTSRNMRGHAAAVAGLVRSTVVLGIGAGSAWLWKTQHDRDVLKLPNVTTVDLLGAVGHTPLIELKSLSAATGCKIYGKAEYLNPTGSVKDRAAKYLIEDALNTGKLKPGGTLIEATGGNTGIALAAFAQAKGLKTIFTMPDFIAKEKISAMETFGAKVYVQPSTSFQNAEHYYQKAVALSKSVPNSFFTDQFMNVVNMKAHEETTGPEIYRQTRGKLDAFVAASGTGGTIAGCSKYLKSKLPNLKVFLVDPEGGATTDYIKSGKTNGEWIDGREFVPRSSGSSHVEGVGLNYITDNFRQAVIDDAMLATDVEMLKMMYYLVRHDGIFVGPSAALNAVGAVKVARKLGPGHTIVTILCDGGDRYRSKMYNKEWLKSKTLLHTADESPDLNFIKDA